MSPFPLARGRGSLGKSSKRSLPLDPPTKHGPRQFGGPRAMPAPQPIVEKIKREKATTAKVDPKLIAAARELRDRWLEQMNAADGEAIEAVAGKYDVCRLVSSRESVFTLPQTEARLLSAA